MPWLFIAFLVVPLIELWVIIQVGQVIGAGWTIVLLLGVSVLGAVLVRREGLKAWERFRAALREARLPAEEVIDGALVLLAGALMLTPGFVTDTVGVLLLIPPTRSAVNRGIRRRVRWSFGLSPGARRPSRNPRPGEPIDVEVVSVERHDPAGPQRRSEGPQPREGS